MSDGGRWRGLSRGRNRAELRRGGASAPGGAEQDQDDRYGRTPIALRLLRLSPYAAATDCPDEGGPASGTILGFDHNYVLRESSSSWLAKIPLLRRLVAPSARATSCSTRW
eukprot:2208189-Rhodomonas_salina.2